MESNGAIHLVYGIQDFFVPLGFVPTSWQTYLFGMSPPICGGTEYPWASVKIVGTDLVVHAVITSETSVFVWYASA